ncbi:MAG: cellulose-binding protein [Polyangiaceae bacterium]
MNARNRGCSSVFTDGSTWSRNRTHFVRSVLSLSMCLGAFSGCSSDGSPSEPATGGNHTGISGAAAVAGSTGVAGKIEAAGGTSGSAGATAVGGGATAASGAPAVGGAGGASGGSVAVAGASVGGGAGVGSVAVENQSADCAVAALPEASALPTIAKLPDPFKKLDGTRVSSKADWRCRRQEIRAQAEKYIFGAKPTPEVVTGTVSNTSIAVHVEAKGKSIDFSAAIVLPSKGQAPFPALINVGTKGSLTLGESRILDQGVAVIYYNNYDLGKEGTAEQSRGKPNPGKYYDIYGGTDPAGLLMAWAWGASRILDVLQKSGGGIIDVSGIGVTGCSRFGKGAFAIGVFDDRIALTIPQEPSTGGDPALRIMDKLSGAERTDYNYNGLNWLSNNFAPFVFANNTSNAVKLPIDTHALVAMIAPRGLLVLENPHQTQMGAPAGHMATLAGLEVYKALGVEKNVSYHSSVADTAHCSYKTEYTDLIAKSISAFLKHEGDAPGQFLVGSGGSLTRSDWIDWQAPTLQ